MFGSVESKINDNDFDTHNNTTDVGHLPNVSSIEVQDEWFAFK